MKGKITFRDRKFFLIEESGEERVLPFQPIANIAKVSHADDSLRLIAFSDFRVQSLESLIGFLKSQVQPDLILYGGDDVKRFRETGANFFERLAEISRYGICAVAGNDDSPDVRNLITGRHVYAVHSCPLVLGTLRNCWN